MDAAPLVEIIKDYQYGPIHTVQNGMQIFQNPDTKQVLFSPLYHHLRDLTSGSDTELMNRASRDIKNAYPHLQIIKVIGQHPDFFNKPGEEHCYLLVNENDLMSGKSQVEDRKTINQIRDQDPLLVDPSFKRVESISGTGYRIDSLVSQEQLIGYSNEKVVENNHGVPLGMTSEGNLVYIMVNFDSEVPLNIGFQQAGKKIEQYELDTDYSQILEDDAQILELIDILKQKEIKKAKKPFKVKHQVFIR